MVMTGDKKVNRMLKKLPSKQQKAAFRKAARPAIKPVMTEARSNIKKDSDTGKLAKTVKVRALKRSRSRIGVRVTTRAEDVDGTFYGAFQEYGWKAGKAKRQIKGTENITKAAESKRTAVMRDYSERMKKQIEETARRP